MNSGSRIRKPPATTLPSLSRLTPPGAIAAAAASSVDRPTSTAVAPHSQAASLSQRPNPNATPVPPPKICHRYSNGGTTSYELLRPTVTVLASIINGSKNPWRHLPELPAAAAGKGRFTSPSFDPVFAFLEVATSLQRRWVHLQQWRLRELAAFHLAAATVARLSPVTYLSRSL